MGTEASAAFYGLLSAVSLPLGAALGLWLRPGARWTSSLMAFGGGALLAALTLELAAESLESAGFTPVAVGFVLGAVLFMVLNRTLNGHGGFLRKVSTTTRYLLQLKRRRALTLLERLGRVRFLRSLPPEEVQAILPFAEEVSFTSGETVFRLGDPGDAMYLIEEGSAEVLTGEGETASLAVLKAGDVFGEMALLTGAPRSASVRASGPLRAWAFPKDDFDRLLEVSPGLRDGVQRLLKERVQEQVDKSLLGEEEAHEWVRTARDHAVRLGLSVTRLDVQNAAKQHGGGAALAIWLGILLDGIPESMVIGGTVSPEHGVSMTLIAGVFLANFPEALSSAVGMRNQGRSVGKVLWMWTSLMLLTGLGALVGNLTREAMAGDVFALVQATAGGAMLAMIAETMLPEATEQGGPATGLMTVLGFLAAVFVSHLEHM